MALAQLEITEPGRRRCARCGPRCYRLELPGLLPYQRGCSFFANCAHSVLPVTTTAPLGVCRIEIGRAIRLSNAGINQFLAGPACASTCRPHSVHPLTNQWPASPPVVYRQKLNPLWRGNSCSRWKDTPRSLSRSEVTASAVFRGSANAIWMTLRVLWVNRNRSDAQTGNVRSCRRLSDCSSSDPRSDAQPRVVSRIGEEHAPRTACVFANATRAALPAVNDFWAFADRRRTFR